MFEQERTVITDKAKRLEEQKRAINDKFCLKTTAVATFKQYKGIEKLNRADIGNLVNEIVVDGERNISINFMFDDEVKKYVSFFEKQQDRITIRI